MMSLSELGSGLSLPNYRAISVKALITQAPTGLIVSHFKNNSYYNLSIQLADSPPSAPQAADVSISNPGRNHTQKPNPALILYTRPDGAGMLGHRKNRDPNAHSSSAGNAHIQTHIQIHIGSDPDPGDHPAVL